MFSFNLSSTVSSTMPLLSMRWRKSPYFSMVARFSSETSKLRVPLGLACMVYMMFNV